MEKLFLLPLILLLLNCSSSKNSQQATNDEKEMEQPISIGGSTTQPAEEPIAGEEQTKEHVILIDQGIAGKILWESGNQMPSPDAPRSSGKRGVKRTVYIYELTSGSQVTTKEGVFHSKIQTKLVNQTVSDADGNFEVRLEPGQYSVFTKEDQGLYANLFDGQNNIYPVEVKKGQVTKIEFLINYAATY